MSTVETRFDFSNDDSVLAEIYTAGTGFAAPKRNEASALIRTLAIVAHDFRGPLANIISLLELIDYHCQMQNSGQVKRCVEKGLAIADSLADLLSSSLERIEQFEDSFGHDPLRVDIRQILEAAKSQNQPVADKKKIRINVCGGRQAYVWGDRTLLLQTLDNLINNAVKYSKEGTSVTCNLITRDNQAVVSISDQGAGMSDDALKKLFSPFATICSANRNPRESIGLGLWIAKMIVEAHGGKILAGKKSNGAGFVMTIKLPTDVPVRERVYESARA